MALARTQREWAILVGEYNICKKKLQSKREALKIITKEWETSKKETEIYKNKVNQLQQDLDKYVQGEKNEKQRLAHSEQPNSPERVQSPDLVTSHTSKDTLTQLIYEYKQANKALRYDFQELKKLYIESQEDVQLMRDRMRRQSSSSSSHGDEASDTVTDGKEECILQLEEYKEQLVNLEQELKSVKDENIDIVSERDSYKEKCERLNTQLNYILGADDRRLVDIDALVLDNKYLKEKLVILEEERSLEKECIQKYEAAFEKKKNKILHQRNGGRLASYYSKHSHDHSVKTVADLRNVANILSETITEKNLALSHQKSANRILGKRVSELENKLKTLEVAGLWSLPGHRGYGSVNLASDGFEINKSSLEDNGFKNTVSRVIGHPEDDGGGSPQGRMESNENSVLMIVNDNEGIGDPSEINGNVLDTSCCRNDEEHCSCLAPMNKLSPSNFNCDICRSDSDTPEKHLNNLRLPCPRSLLEERCSSPEPGTSFLSNSPVLSENFTKRKLSRVCSAPCLTRSWSLDETTDFEP
ncbi:coiled-coil domain-containing protein 149-A-like [Dendronephthya gigantea]|uniref:coiled-coil domain-containing protein 149-A-like n=1 Tax=Dendronephthya gigantea TaxID=151771 RepID=UPI00106B2542|nr:coiled-coil domain-containing protein 149-A-like [Dendronephthya gigantea]